MPFRDEMGKLNKISHNGLSFIYQIIIGLWLWGLYDHDSTSKSVKKAWIPSSTKPWGYAQDPSPSPHWLCYQQKRRNALKSQETNAVKKP